MKVGILGTGEVGQVIARKLAAIGHDVFMGARSTSNEKALAFAEAFRTLNKRITNFSALSLENLDSIARQEAVDEIGRTHL